MFGAKAKRRRKERQWVFRPVRDRLRVTCDGCGRAFEAHVDPGMVGPDLDACPACGRATTVVPEEISA